MAAPTYPLEVLIVEDEEPYRKILSVVLREKGGYVVEECESGEEAIEALRASPAGHCPQGRGVGAYCR